MANWGDQKHRLEVHTILQHSVREQAIREVKNGTTCQYRRVTPEAIEAYEDPNNRDDGHTERQYEENPKEVSRAVRTVGSTIVGSTIRKPQCWQRQNRKHHSEALKPEALFESPSNGSTRVGSTRVGSTRVEKHQSWKQPQRRDSEVPESEASFRRPNIGSAFGSPSHGNIRVGSVIRKSHSEAPFGSAIQKSQSRMQLFGSPRVGCSHSEAPESEAAPASESSFRSRNVGSAIRKPQRRKHQAPVESTFRKHLPA
ncbi:hypothetical protein BJ508DRAFT_335778 [Ascobolus immersus RN42]|uniref:Uncharacterized protein n=1 Tax=Ascobolus immersus RN42 TaxID=1160509 RepID=A0A3N4HB55_ASCIM|nr:hypothetical protein BJ508DRAFT_335778 [Ascobolus immersus RN42]